MEELICFGTGHAMTWRIYHTCFSLSDGNSHFMVDTGGGSGILKQLEDSGLSPQELSHVFLSHLHTDHVLGAVWLARVAGQDLLRGEREKPLQFYGHESVLAGFRQICDVVISKRLLPLFGEKILFRPVRDGESVPIDERLITFFDIGAEKTLQYGFQTELANGEKLTFLGDEPLHPPGEIYAQGTDHLIHEAFCLEAEVDFFKPHEKAHSSVKDAALNAKRMGVQQLILVHTEQNRMATKHVDYPREAQQYFSGKVSCPQDLDRIALSL